MIQKTNRHFHPYPAPTPLYSAAQSPGKGK